MVRRPVSFGYPDWSISTGDEVVVRASAVGRTLNIVYYDSYESNTVNFNQDTIAKYVQKTLETTNYPYIVTFRPADPKETLKQSMAASELRKMEQKIRAEYKRQQE